MPLSFTDPAVTPAEATAYLSAAGVTGWPSDEALQEQAIMRGQRAIAAQFNDRWLPGVTFVPVPDAVKYAIAEAALVEAVAPGSLNTAPPDKVLTGAGKLSWTLTGGKPGTVAGKLPENIEGLLFSLIGPVGAENGWSWA